MTIDDKHVPNIQMIDLLFIAALFFEYISIDITFSNGIQIELFHYGEVNYNHHSVTEIFSVSIYI